MRKLLYLSSVTAVTQFYCATLHSELSANGETYRFDYGLLWPYDGTVFTSKAVNGVIATGPKVPGSFNRDCRHWHIDGSLTRRYAPVEEIQPDGWDVCPPIYRYTEGSQSWDVAGMFPYVSSPTQIIGDKNFRVYRSAWLDGDINYVSTYYRYFEATLGRFVDGPINLVSYTKGQAIYQIAKVRGVFTYNDWVDQNYTIKYWTPRVSTLHVGSSAPFLESDLKAIKILRLNESLPDRDEILGHLSAECLSSLRVQDTSIVTDIVDTVMDLALGGLKGLFISQIKHIKDVPNVFASAYLAWKFGVIVPIKSTISSIRAYAKGVRSSCKPTKCYASGVIYRNADMVTTARCRLMVDPWPNGFLQFMDSLYRLSFGVDFKDLWDLVPLSFLVDYFWHIDDVLATDRTRVDEKRYNIIAATYSLKTVKTVTREQVIIDGASDWAGEVQYIDYERWTLPGPILPNYAFTIPTIDGLGECWLDLSSVIVSLFWGRRS